MKRNLDELKNKTYDVAVIGGGIYGAALAWEAASRGLSVALFEKDDFGSHTSSNSLKVAHGGLRYLQHLDFKRMRESIRERTRMMVIAPNLVHWQPFVIPTMKPPMKSKWLMRAALFANDVISVDRLWMRDPSKRIPNGYMMSKKDFLEFVPNFPEANVTGGAVWYDGQFYNTERMLLSFLSSAHERGACLVNYAEVTALETNRNRVTGLHVRDRLTDRSYSISSRLVINASGPWFSRFAGSKALAKPIVLSKAFSLVTREITKDRALGIFIKPMYEEKRSVVKKGSNLIFAIPWRGHSIVGSLHLPHDGSASDAAVTETEINLFLARVNEAYPALALKRTDVKAVLSGLVPAAETGSAEPLKHYRLIDHAAHEDLEGLISVLGVKYTTSRDVAEKTIDLAFRKLNRNPVPSQTEKTPLYGCEIDDFNAFLEAAVQTRPDIVTEDEMRELATNYGTLYPKILSYLESEPERHASRRESSFTSLRKAEIRHAVRHEMAVKLEDVLLRRTDIGTLGDPGEAVIEAASILMAHELGWDESRRLNEVEEVGKAFDFSGDRHSAIHIEV